MARRAKIVLQAAAVSVVALLIALLGWQVTREETTGGVAAALASGKSPPAPDFDLERLDADGRLQLSSEEGRRVVVVNFWASWCLPCKDEAGILEAGGGGWGGEGALIFVLALVAAGSAAASEQHPTLAELEDELVCPTCKTTLAMSNAPVAERMRAFIRQRIAAGDTKSEIKDKLVAEFGESVLAAPPARGFNLLAWLLPIAGALAALLAGGLLARRWSRSRAEPGPGASADGRGPLDP